jgi:hypothetical protein
MAYFAGLDVSVKETSVCIVDDAGKIVREARVASEPEALPSIASSELGWKLDRCRSGFTAFSPKRARQCVLRHDTCEPC